MAILQNSELIFEFSPICENGEPYLFVNVYTLKGQSVPYLGDESELIEGCGAGLWHEDIVSLINCLRKICACHSNPVFEEWINTEPIGVFLTFERTRKRPNDVKIRTDELSYEGIVFEIDMKIDIFKEFAELLETELVEMNGQCPPYL